jgi:hypothetical protein
MDRLIDQPVAGECVRIPQGVTASSRVASSLPRELSMLRGVNLLAAVD